jgi:hypothetical protein
VGCKIRIHFSSLLKKIVRQYSRFKLLMKKVQSKFLDHFISMASIPVILGFEFQMNQEQIQ